MKDRVKKPIHWKKIIAPTLAALAAAGVAVPVTIAIMKKNQSSSPTTVQHTITYVDNFDSSSPTIKTDLVKSGEKAIMPHPKHRENNGFLGWKQVKWVKGSTESKNAPYFDFMNTPITKDLKLYAHWKTAEEAAETEELTNKAWIADTKTIEGKLLVKFNYQYLEEHPNNLDIIIPDKLDGVPVEGIAPDAFHPQVSEYDTQYQTCPLRSISIPDGVQVFSQEAFAQCANLRIINIPTNLLVINDACFLNCYKLSHIELNEKLEYIGDGAFGGGSQGSPASYLKEIKMPSTLKWIGNGAFFCNAIQKLDLSNCTQLQLSENAFDNAINLIEITLPTGLRYIPKYCFNYCTRLRYITIPKTVTYIDECAFSDCYRIRQVIFEKDSTLFSIGESAFYKCHSLESIHFPGTIKSIGSYAFDSCENLQEASFSSIREWEYEDYDEEGNPKTEHWTPDPENYTSNVKKIKEVTSTLGTQLTVNPETDTTNKIKYLTNDSNKAVIVGTTTDHTSTTLTIPATVAYTDPTTGITSDYDVIGIGDDAFAGNTTITDVNFGKNTAGKVNLEYILSRAFQGCSNITDINLKDCSNLSYIGDQAFEAAFVKTSKTLDLNFVNVPLTYIGDYAFKGSGDDTDTGLLNEITLPKELTYLGTGAFLQQKQLSKIDFTSCNSLKDIGRYRNDEEHCGALISETTKEISINLSNTNLTYLPRSIFQGAKNLTTINLPNKLTHIYDFAFEGCSALKTITIPEYCTHIRNNAFTNSGLTTANFGTANTNQWLVYKGTEYEICDVSQALEEAPDVAKANAIRLKTKFNLYNWVKE